MIYLPDIQNIYLGTSGVTKIMLGDVQVWPSKDYASEYFTIESLATGYFWFKRTNGLSPLVTIEYSLNGGAWTTYTEEVPIVAGDKVRVRGNNSTYGGSNPTGSTIGDTANNTSHIIGTKTLTIYDECDYKMYGNAMSLVYGDNFASATTFTEPYAFVGLFNRRTINQGFCVDASNLILPATTLTKGCYSSLFVEQHFEVAPKLPASYVPNSAYMNMFALCYNLREVTCLATNLEPTATSIWFESGGASEGVFYKHPNMTWERGKSGVPNNWIIRDAQI